MQKIDGQLLYSATDLVGFLACAHLTNLDFAATSGLVQRPMRVDPELDRIAKRGLQHEARFLAELEKPGVTVTKIEPDASIEDPGVRLRQAVENTLAAMRRGADVIYQAALSDGRRRGHPDFLLKVDSPSDLGHWSYEVWDTKLARKAKGSAVLQLCLYSDLLALAQGAKPERMYLALGGSRAEKVGLRFDDYAAYYRLVSAEFERHVFGEQPAYPPETRADPVEHCDVCRWSEACRKERRRTDDLSLVAGITSNQRRHLRERDVPTRTDLATLSLPLQPPLRGTTAQGLSRVREQARIQVEGDQEGALISELLEPARTRDGDYEARGLLSLPLPSKGDLFFDIEGDPFALDDGVDYLFGVIEPRLLDSTGQATFHSFWSIDAENQVTPEAERTAFEAFIDLVMDRLALDPNLHVYHYAPYEPTAVKRLMGRYGTREDEVDRLLRGGVFVDLFHAARQGIRASVESYSIKRLEPLYGFTREVDLRDAGSSIVAFETWLELGGEVEDDPRILERIEAYNKDDCVSTWKLRDWLEEQRGLLGNQWGLLPRPVPSAGDPSADLTEVLAQTQAVYDSLVAGVPDDATKRTPEQQAQWLLAQLLHWHRREAKSTWWRYYYLKDVLTDEDRISEPDALGGLTPEGIVGEEKQSYIYRFSFPPQEHKISEGSDPRDQTGGRAGRVVAVSEEGSYIDIKRGKRSDPPTPTSLLPLDHVSAVDLQKSLLRAGHWVTQNAIHAQGANAGGRDLLLRRPPKVGQAPGMPLVQHGEKVDEAARRLVLQLEASYLAIQGPPGSGKTSVGAEMIVDLVAAGKRVGVTANSHKVIGQLLQKAAEVASKRGMPVRIGQRTDADGD
ncbi:MAG TPA: TM0106 family RecB-like putative nuclease, partial [Dehalococcoidia bacterium]|nr:TM0106 family RecB-like putative nuclease [Dehalococcoidia bacterium]